MTSIRTFPIHAGYVDAFKDAISKINNKIEQANEKSSLDISTVSYKLSNPIITNKGLTYCNATITVPELSKEYIYIGMIDHVNDMILSEDDDYSSILEKYRYNYTCDHCKKDIKRNNTYLHFNKDTNEYIHVGGSCSDNYFKYPMNIVHAFIDMYMVMDSYTVGVSDYDDEESSSYNLGRYYSLDTVLHTIYIEVKHNGYAKEEYIGDPLCTKNIIKRYMDDASSCSLDSELDVNGFVQYVNSKEESSYINNIKVIVNRIKYEDIKNIAVTYKQIGLFPYIMNEYINHLNHHVSTGYYGKIGDKIDVECSYNNKHQYISSYDGSKAYVYTFITDDGCHLVWHTSKLLDYDIGTKIKLKGSIKNHNIYRDDMQTIVTRCKIAQL